MQAQAAKKADNRYSFPFLAWLVSVAAVLFRFYATTASAMGAPRDSTATAYQLLRLATIGEELVRQLGPTSQP